MLRQWHLIGVDRSGNEHPVFETHRSIGEAADLALMKHAKFIKVVCGDGNSGRDNYRGKFIRARKNMNIHAMGTLLGDSLVQAQQDDLTQRSEAAHMIIRRIEGKGFELAYVEEGEATEVRSRYLSQDGEPQALTPEDLNDIQLHKDTIIQVLKERAPPEPSKPTKKKRGRRPAADPAATQQDLINSIIQQLPERNAFKEYDIVLALRRLGRHDIADDSAKLEDLLTVMTQSSRITRLGTADAYRVVHSQSISPPGDLFQPVDSSQPNKAEVLKPEQQMVPIEPEPELPRRSSGFQSLLENLLSNALTDSACSCDAEVIDKAIRKFQDGMLSLVEELGQDLRPVVDRLRDQERLRKSLRGRILDPSNNS